METAIAILAGLVALVGGLLQLTLIIEGLYALGRLVVPFLPKEGFGWFTLWGGWHLVVLAILSTFAHDKLSVEMEAYQQVAFQLEGLRIMAMIVVLPLVVSFLISRLHQYARAR